MVWRRRMGQGEREPNKTQNGGKRGLFIVTTDSAEFPARAYKLWGGPTLILIHCGIHNIFVEGEVVLCLGLVCI